jgi:hypothetical protein
MSLLLKQHCSNCCHVPRGARGGTNNLGGFANAKSFATVQTAMYYIAGSPEVYDSSNPKDTPGRINYVGPPNDQKLCSTWYAAG